MIHISKGNSKIGKIPNISLRPIADCGNCAACASKCYAMKAYRQYPAVRKNWNENSEAFRKDPMEAVSEIGTWIFMKQPKYFRIHVAGDFLNQLHLDGWIDIANIYTHTQFMVNTKMFGLDYSDLPSNMHVRFSMWPSQVIPEGHMPKAWVQDGTELRIPLNAVECEGNCDNCLICYTTNKDIVFNIH